MQITIKDLTTDEKLKLLRAKDRWHVEDLDGKLPKVSVADGPIGLRVEKDGVHGCNLPATGFPSITTLANTWSLQCAYKMGECLADECIERDVDILLAPGVNIKRVPVNGRNFEYFSEDPYLAGIMAKSYILGVQSHGVGVCLKHFVANNLEYDRFHQSSDVDERTLREIYYKPFEIACEANPATVMCSYNRINGVYASENKKGFTVLRNEFGFGGVIFSDWNAVRNRTACLNAGLDIEYPYCEESYTKFVEDYKNGLVPEENINASAERVLKLIYDTEKRRAGAKIQTTVEERISVAESIAEEGIVLLKNNGVLPIGKDKTVAVSGIYAKPDNIGFLMGGGAARVNWADKRFDLTEELAKYVKSVIYESAFYGDVIRSSWQDCRAAVLNAKQSDVAIVCCGTGVGIEYEEGDRHSIRLPEVQERCILDTANQNKNTVVIIFAGSAIDVSLWQDNVAAIIFVGFAGMGTDRVLAKILSGKVNPSGKLSETFAVSSNDIPACKIAFSTGVTRYQEGLDIGYRYFDKYGVNVAYPFGYGLSYSEFKYSDLNVEIIEDRIVIEYNITNISGTDGKEVSQVYVGDCVPLVYRPKKELKAFSKDLIKARECKKIHIELVKKDFAYYSIADNGWKVDDGMFQITVGPSSDIEALNLIVKVENGKLHKL